MIAALCHSIRSLKSNGYNKRKGLVLDKYKLTNLNKKYPRKPSILKRLALAYEQIRQPQKAVAYLKVYRKVSGDDVWANTQMEKFRALGVM